MGAAGVAGVAVFSTEGGFDFSVSTGLFGGSSAHSWPRALIRRPRSKGPHGGPSRLRRM